MSRFKIVHERVDEPTATEPLERATWSQFRLDVENSCVTRFWNQANSAEQRTLYIPLYDIAEWIVQNWWALLYEPCIGETPPREHRRLDASSSAWLHRHCLRTAESGLLLPYLHIYSNGPHICLSWEADESQSVPTQALKFLDSGFAQLERPVAELELREFIGSVLEWCAHLEDPRLVALRHDWQAISGSDEQERKFCAALGRMGIDPYDAAAWPADLEEFVNATLATHGGEDIVDDFFECVEPDNAAGVWNWIIKARTSQQLSRRQFHATPTVAGFRTAKDQGYALARQIRELSGVAPNDPVPDPAGIVREACAVSVSQTPHNHLPSRNVNAVVGWNGSNAYIVGPQLARPDNNRFLFARGIYQALAGCSSGPRLLTRASTWHQQASRAFAAEFLAPMDALSREASGDMDVEEREGLQESLARKYDVSTEVVRLQLYNQGVWR